MKIQLFWYFTYYNQFSVNDRNHRKVLKFENILFTCLYVILCGLHVIAILKMQCNYM